MSIFHKLNRFTYWVPACALLLLAGCGSEVSSQTGGDTTDVSSLPLVTIDIASGDQIHHFVVEIADTAKTRQVGLMHRTEMASDHGMLFLFDYPHKASMWMQNTYISLDMLFIDQRGIVRSIARETVPMTTTHIRSAGPVSAVLELNAGVSAALGLKPGDKVRHPFFTTDLDHP
jgi:uncharacterized membrane protein (UPF0127 family)